MLLKKEKDLGFFKNRVSFSGGCVSCLNFIAFFKPFFVVYILIPIFLLILASNIQKIEK